MFVPKMKDIIETGAADACVNTTLDLGSRIMEIEYALGHPLPTSHHISERYYKKETLIAQQS